MATFHAQFSRFLKEGGVDISDINRAVNLSTYMEDIFIRVWNANNNRNILVVPACNPAINKKGKMESDKFRNEGNRLYKEKKLEKTLLAYNYSIMAAPYPSETVEGETVGNQESESLSFALANRSALLFEMGQYEACLRDIRLSQQFGYPIEKAYKLQERKAKCYLFLDHEEQAKDTVEDAISSIKGLSISSKDKETIVSSLRRTIAKFHQLSTNPRTGIEYTNIFYTGPLMPPDLLYVSKTSSVISDAMQVSYSKARGRHFVATRDIIPGELLMSEPAYYSAVMRNSNLRRYCSHCLRRAPVPVPCPSCSLVVFCNESCQRKSTRSGGLHANECQHLPSLIALDFDLDAILTFRIFSDMNINELKEKVIQLADSTGTPVLDIKQDYSFLWNLEDHIDKRSHEEILETACLAVLISKILVQTPSFIKDYPNNDGSASLSEDDIKMLGGQVSSLICKIQCNCHYIKELRMESEDKFKDAVAITIGYGIYSGMSFLNHSCYSNTLHSALGNVKYLYAVKCIKNSEEITDSYGERFVSHTLSERQKNLQEAYFFKCNCIACSKKWPLFKDLPVKLSFRCFKCSGTVDLTLAKCNICQSFYGKTPASKNKKKLKKKLPAYNAAEVQTKVAEAWESCNKLFTCGNMLKITTEGHKVISNHLKLISTYSIEPNQPLIEAQESLLRLYDLTGSTEIRN